MSAQTDPALLARYASGGMTYAEYQLEMKRRTQDRETQQAASQLMTHLQTSIARGYTACNNPEQAAALVASELALQAESRRRLEERWARQAAETQRKAREAAYVASQQRVIDTARSTASTCTSEGLGLISDLAAKQQQLEADRQAIAQSQYERTMLERDRQQVEEIPMDWQSLPAEEQGISIAIEMAKRREQLAEYFGDTLDDPEPAFVNMPVIPGASIPDYSIGYTPAPLPSLADVLEDGPPSGPVIDVSIWPDVASGAGYPVDYLPGGSGGSYIGPGAYGDGSYDNETEIYYPSLPKDPGGGYTTGGDGTQEGDDMQDDNWLEDIEQFLRALAEGFRIDVSPGLSDVRVSRSLTSQDRANWMPLILAVAGVFLLIMFLK